MKRFWHTWLAMVAVATVVSTASAQSGSRYAPEIGSYQSILNRAGYGNSMQSAGYAASPQAMQSYGQPAYGQPTQGCGAPGGCNGQMVQGQSGGSFGYTGVPAGNAGYDSQMQQPMATAQPAAPVYQTSPLPAAQPQSAPMQVQGGMVPNSNDQVVSSYDGPCGGAGAAAGYGGYANYAAPAAPLYAPAPAYTAAPVYTPGAAIGGVGAVQGRASRSNSNMVVSVAAAVFVRDYEDTRLIARNPAGDLLFTNEADHDTIGGVDVSIASRNQNGNGWEARYLNLFPDTAAQTLTGAQVSAVGLRGLDRLDYTGATVASFFDAGTSQTITRDTDIRGAEFNLLRNGGRFCTRSGRQGNFELLGGFRWFDFDEEFTYSTADGTTPLDYRLAADNTLLGLQLGGRSEICLSNRLRFASLVKAGLFNNHITTNQRITNPAGDVFATVGGAGPDFGRDFNYGDDGKNDIAMLGEIDLGLIYQLSNKARLRFGYRAIGVAGVALATHQIPYEFDNQLATTSANSNGELLLHGGYIGTEFCF